jgi:hypothetical protein
LFVPKVVHCRLADAPWKLSAHVPPACPQVVVELDDELELLWAATLPPAKMAANANRATQICLFMGLPLQDLPARHACGLVHSVHG